MADKQRRVLDILGVVLAASTLPASAPIKAQARPASSYWGWVQLLKRVFSIDTERWPRCHQGCDAQK
jgi:hypothetical protein